MRSVAAFVLAAAPAVLAETYIVTAKSDLSFEPELTVAKAGDVIEFQFEAQAHSVVQGDSSEACKPASSGFFSGPIPVSGDSVGDKVFRVTLTDDSPIIFYCGTGSHCASGMIGGINVAEDDLSAYKSQADGATTEKPDSVTGGEVADLGSDAESGSPTGGSSSTPTQSSGPAATTSDKPGAAGSLRAGLGFAAAFGVALLMA